jgi:flagellar FliL protein
MASTIADNPTRIASQASRTQVKGSKTKGAGGDGEPGGKRTKSMKLKLAVLVVLLLVGGAAAKFTLLAPAAGATKAAKPIPGPVVAMTDMTLNLSGGHFLRVQVALQLVKGANAELDTSEASQAIIDQFSNQSVAQVTGQSARAKAMAQLVTKLQKIYPKQIMGAYYTSFATQ